MKDASGHGSNTRGGSVYLTPAGRSIMPTKPFRSGAEYDARNQASNAAAAEALASVKYGTMVSIHPAMQGQLNGSSADYTTAEFNALRKAP